jgi:hypothetical protein
MSRRRINFWEVFREVDGQLEPLRRVEINGVSFGPGVRFSKGAAFGGIDLHNYKGLDLDVEEKEDRSVVLQGVYP